MLGGVDDMSMVPSKPYQKQWELAEARRYFARSPGPLAMSLLDERTDDRLLWREVGFAADVGVEALATVVLPLSTTVTFGVVVAHGGSEDGRRFFLSEAAALADRGAAVILPATRIRNNDGVDSFATDVRIAVLTERAALDVLLELGAPADALSFLGHSAGGALGAVLSAVEPRLTRLVIFANGAGALFRADLARGLSGGGVVSQELVAATDWFDPAHYVAVRRRAQLFVQHGRIDTTVPIEAARALFEAAATPRLWTEYDWDHGLDADPQARNDRAHFVMTGELSTSGC